MNAAAGKTDRILIAIIAAITLLVVIALAVVFTRGEPEVLNEATPPGVVQRYSTAVIDGDTATANSYLTQVARSSCSGYRESGPLPARVVLISTTERDNTALVNVSVVTSSPGGPFGPSEYDAEGRFSLVKVDGKWLIDQAPYQLMSCPGTSLKP
ncbi:hypothetical protein NIBR502772_17425 [Pseudarthrobacter sp. NIBRBAC000502772]|uniref:hypothetical protein n=2 Tax=unclassified Pseudarthrobacter TaxID=2647000 RepID=UPI001130D78F|nr:hypothetical protein [Pseudarthrobacter sp. NIBRBAC000502772]QDG67745.1 hypothetical protein NIBR502772_17425 [Pseudarthrobacter sp. NIBRBAC000502772]